MRSSGETLTKALTIFRETGDPPGRVHLDGENAPRNAMAVHEEARGLARETGGRHEEARAAEGVGRCLARIPGKTGAAVGELERALGSYHAIGVPEQTRVAEFIAVLTMRRSP
ncbi:hypothetical protein PS9374_01021 [Planomonospora sphaerica]|uniref:Uncharacterized protein n=1 Tax=Planomonospora sphaerica TaxID=161355 RepID=A0A171BP58_9ACTN|nr:hypothetical protein [Planomonospora sphaerica]GAT65388.1 hypothetical protein PS9374_01021 [Planomonospora sphaerica]